MGSKTTKMARKTPSGTDEETLQAGSRPGTSTGPQERIEDIIKGASHLQQGSFGVIAQSRIVEGKATTTVTAEGGATGPVIGSLVSESFAQDEIIDVISKAGPPVDGVTTAELAKSNVGGISMPLKLENETPVGSAGSLAVGVTAESIDTRNLVSHVTQNLFQIMQKEKAVDHFWTVEPPTQTLASRDELLGLINQKLQDCTGQRTLMKRIVALVGMGGMGKTEIARSFAQQYKHQYPNVAWIDAETALRAKDSFLKIVSAFNIPHSSKAEAEGLAKLVYRHINQHVKTPTLIIFDHANRLKTEGNSFGIFECLPTEMMEGLPVILLTSQTTEWGRYHCEVIQVTELTSVQSLDFFSSHFQITPQVMEENPELRNLLEKLIHVLDGYPIALGIAAANISYIPGQSSLKLLKQSICRYIQRMEEGVFLGDTISRKMASNYPHTLLKVWEIAIQNLQRQENWREAKDLLCILAVCSTYYLASPVPALNLVYRPTIPCRISKQFGLAYPSENDATYEEALHELQTVGLVKVDRTVRGMQIKTHHLIQVITREAYPHEADLGIQKLILYTMSESPGSETCVVFTPRCLWPEEGMPSWALDTEWKAVLWLEALRYLNQYGLKEAVRNNTSWKRQLEKFPNGADIALVAQFLVSNEYPESRCMGHVHGHCVIDHFAYKGDVKLSWDFLEKALQVRSSMVGPSHDIRVYLELVCLINVGFCMKVRVNVDRASYSEVDISEGLGLSSDIFGFYRSWLSDFDFPTGIEVSIMSRFQMLVFVPLCTFQRYCSVYGHNVKLLTAKSLLSSAEAYLAVCADASKHDTTWFQLHVLAGCSDPDDLQVATLEFKLLDHLYVVLNKGWSESVLQSLETLRKLVWKLSGVHEVIRHEDIMSILKSRRLLDLQDGPSSRSKSVYRFLRNERQVKTYPGLVQGALVPHGSEAAENIFIPYRFSVVGIAIYTVLCSDEGLELDSWILAELFPPEQCRLAISCLAAAADFCREVQVSDWDWILTVASFKFISPEELQEDLSMLNCALGRIGSVATPGIEGDWQELLLLLVQTLESVSIALLALLNP